MDERFCLAEANNCDDALREIMGAMPKKKLGYFLGHFNDLFLFITAAKQKMDEGRKKKSDHAGAADLVDGGEDGEGIE